MLALRFAPFAHGCPQGDYLNEGDFETVILESINTDEKGKKNRYLINQEAISNYKSAIGADFRTYDNTPEHKEYLSRFSSRYSVYFIHIAKNGDTEGCENLSLELSKPEDDDAGCLNAVMHNKKKGYTYFGRLIAPTGLDWAFISFAQIQNTQRCDQGWMAFRFEKKDVAEYHGGVGVIMSIDRNREGIIQFQRALMVEKDSEKPTQDEIDEYLHKPFQPSEEDDRVHNNRYREYIISVSDVDNCNGKLFSSTRADLDE